MLSVNVILWYKSAQYCACFQLTCTYSHKQWHCPKTNTNLLHTLHNSTKNYDRLVYIYSRTIIVYNSMLCYV